MVDQVLSWFVVFAPFLLTIIFIFIPAKSENRAAHMKWRFGLLFFGLIFSVIAWIQQSRASKATSNQITEAIKTTAETVSANTASGVTDSINKQYGPYVSGLYKEISGLQAQIAAQTGLRKEDMQLNYAPEVDVVYAGDRLQLYNRGRTNIRLWGSKYDGYPADIETKPVVFGPTDFYYLMTDEVKSITAKTIGSNGEERVPIEFYISTEDNTKYIMNCELLEIMKSGNLEIRPQCHGYRKADWNKAP